MLYKNIELDLNNPRYIKVFSYLLCFYAVSLFSAQFMTYKLVSFSFYTFSAGTLICPIWYLIGDLITELFGYKITRNLIFITNFVFILFSLLFSLIIKLPSPEYWSHQSDYNYVIGNLPKIAVLGVLGIILGGLFNSFLLSKLRVLVKGKFFALRSFFSGILGHCIFIIIVAPILFWGTMPFNKIVQFMLESLLTKTIMLMILVYPNALVLYILKRILSYDVKSN